MLNCTCLGELLQAKCVACDFAAVGSPTAMNIFRKLTLCKPQTYWLACRCELHSPVKTQAPDTQHEPVWITAVPRQVSPSPSGLLLTALFLSSSPAFGTNCRHATSLQQLGRSPVTPMQFLVTYHTWQKLGQGTRYSVPFLVHTNHHTPGRRYISYKTWQPLGKAY